MVFGEYVDGLGNVFKSLKHNEKKDMSGFFKGGRLCGYGTV